MRLGSSTCLGCLLDLECAWLLSSRATVAEHFFLLIQNEMVILMEKTEGFQGQLLFKLRKAISTQSSSQWGPKSPKHTAPVLNSADSLMNIHWISSHLEIRTKDNPCRLDQAQGWKPFSYY